MPKVICENCDMLFHKKIAEIKRTNHNFCSKSCRGNWLTKIAKSRFYSHVNVTQKGCWEWARKKNKCGYGVVRINGKTIMAHVYSFMHHHGIEDTGGAIVCHRCDNPACINPEHLFLGSHRDNMADMWRKGRGYSKLSRKTLGEIRASDMSVKELADKYGLAERTIRRARQKSYGEYKYFTHWRPLPAPPKQANDC